MGVTYIDISVIVYYTVYVVTAYHPEKYTSDCYSND